MMAITLALALIFFSASLKDKESVNVENTIYRENGQQ